MLRIGQIDDVNFLRMPSLLIENSMLRVTSLHNPCGEGLASYSARSEPRRWHGYRETRAIPKKNSRNANNLFVDHDVSHVGKYRKAAPLLAEGGSHVGRRRDEIRIAVRSRDRCVQCRISCG